jgi:hypothetical protein
MQSFNFGTGLKETRKKPISGSYPERDFNRINPEYKQIFCQFSGKEDNSTSTHTHRQN